MQPGDRLICAFVKPPEAGDVFKQWPLHVTIVPWFRASVPSDTLAAELGQSLAGIKPFEVKIDGEAHFGRNKLVNIIQQPTPFMEIEKRVRSILKAHGAWIVDETTKAKRSYRPHVTEQKNERLHQGDKFICSELFIIEQKGSFKQVTEVVELSNEAQA